MSKQEILNLFVDDVDVRKKKIVEFIKDENNSYEDRLEVWKKTPSHLQTIYGWIIHLDDFDAKYGEISWYNDFYVKRYADCDLTDCLSYKDWDEEKIKDFNTECMKLGIHGFTFDW